jgi:hypothetical protein
MYAVTGNAREYAEVHPTSTGAVRLYLIEECRAENEAGGWNLYWYNDGSEGGCVLAEMWGWTGESDVAQPLVGELEDIMDEAEIATLYDREETVVPAPFGVRYRTLTEAEFEGLEWEDLARCQQLGRLDRWRTWQDRLCA